MRQNTTAGATTHLTFGGNFYCRQQREVLRQISQSSVSQVSNTTCSEDQLDSKRAKRKRREECDQVSRLVAKVKKQKLSLEEAKAAASEEALRHAQLEIQIQQAETISSQLRATLTSQRMKYKQLLAEAAAKLEQGEHAQSSSLDMGPFTDFLQIRTVTPNQSWQMRLEVARSSIEFLLLRVPSSSQVEYRPINHHNLKKVPDYLQQAVFFESAQLPVWLAKVFALLCQ